MRRRRFDDIVIRLENWGIYIDKGVGGIGYSNRTIEGKLLDGELLGIHTNYQDHSPNIRFAHVEQETHRAVIALPRDWQLIVWELHVHGKSKAEIAREARSSAAWVSGEYDKILASLAAWIKCERMMKKNENN